MMYRFTLAILIFTLVAGCSTASAMPPASTFTSVPTSGESSVVLASPTQAGATEVQTSAATKTARPPLAPDEWKTLPVVPAGISDSMREVYRRGLEMGNDPKHFSVIGDCQNVSSYFLYVYDHPSEFSLGEQYASLQPTIDYYQGSYSRKSLAVRGGFNVAAVQSPLRADPKSCNKNESPLDCELRTWKPSVVFVSMETWWSEKPAEVYGTHMRHVIERILATGAVPIIATKADNLEGDNSINATIAQIAYDYDIPLWNFWAAVQPLPNHGLSSDNFHLTFARNFFDDPERMKNAWPWRNLTALQALDAVHRGLVEQP
ncbi:MAG TPA: hypothetical protein VLE49_22025 [Anaerolineales bacterium]|nr:hypothetical protein [Anaerolineales bacterium]